MEHIEGCSVCGSPAQLVCMCEVCSLCQSCVSRHITDNQILVHTFLPIQSKRLMTSGIDCYTAIRRVQSDKSYKILLKDQIDSLERFKYERIEAINRSADSITSHIHSLIAQQQEKLEREVIEAKSQGHEFSERLLNSSLNKSDHMTNVFYKNVGEKNVEFKKLNLYRTGFEQQQFEESLDSAFNFKVVCPTDLLFEITRTTEEYKGWLEELDNRKKEALRRAERRLQRFLGEYGVWNVSGPPKTDCTSFTVNVDIWLLGLGMGNSNTSGSTTRIQTLEIRETKSTQGKLLYKHPEEPSATWDGNTDNKYFKVPFKEPVRIIANTDYTIRVQYAAGGQIWAAGGTISNTIEEVTFTFSKSTCEGGDSDNNGNSVTAGPTRDIYFSLDKVQL
mmetsp:Transcript_7403/g.13803  ORF Transcript_7403/g.13803 Transcript_7403/m.13803 type:complete len:391 (+) Transcript_7403:85-1257(+)